MNWRGIELHDTRFKRINYESGVIEKIRLLKRTGEK